MNTSNAVILGNNPYTCGHAYPTTRDGRCHGCGDPAPVFPPTPDGKIEDPSVPLGITAPLNPRHLSADPEHFTPLHVVKAARETLVEIDLDPSTTVEGNMSRVGAKSIYTASDNGFSKPWQGRVFLNPPGGKCDREGVCLWSIEVGKDDKGKKKNEWTCDPMKESCGHEHAGSQSAQKAWWQKLALAWEAGQVEAAVFVGFSVEILQTTQVKPVGPLPLEFPICVPKNRLAYDREIRLANGNVEYRTGTSPPHASVLIFLPPLGESVVRFGMTQPSDTHEAIERFVEAFSPIGHVSVPWRWR